MDEENTKVAKKWTELIQLWLDTDMAPDNLTAQIWKGCPNQFRTQAWPLMLKIKKMEMLQEHQYGPNVYERMKARAQHESSDLKHIELDVPRSLKSHESYDKLKYSVMKVKLFHVLSAYSVFNKEIGYCSGMASIVGHILTFLEEEEDAFWALVCLMDDERYQMKELFLPGRPKIFPYFNHHLVLRKQFLPSVHKHLEKHNYEPNLYAFKWFALCYLESLPTSLVLRVWDVFLLEGEEILSAMAIALLKTCKKNILNSDFDQLHDFFSKLNEIQLDDEKIMKNLSKVVLNLRKKGMSRFPKAALSEKSHS